MDATITRARRAAVAVAVAIACLASAAYAQPLPDHQQRQTFRMNLGGPSGTYTDWEMGGLQGFHELRATIDVSKVHGKPRDTWAALARLALVGPGEADERGQCSLLLIHDRKDKTRRVVFEHADERIGLDFGLPPEGKVEFGLKRVAPGELRIEHGDQYSDVPCPIEIVGARALGSGVDVSFDPLTVTSNAP